MTPSSHRGVEASDNLVGWNGAIFFYGLLPVLDHPSEARALFRGGFVVSYLARQIVERARTDVTDLQAISLPTSFDDQATVRRLIDRLEIGNSDGVSPQDVSKIPNDIVLGHGSLSARKMILLGPTFNRSFGN